MNNIKNPFLKPAIVNAKDIWGEKFCDFAELNANISNQIIEALDQVSGTFSIAVVGNVGTGKTQLFSRIRHQLTHMGKAFCVYINADQIASLDFVAVAFQQFLIDSLFHQGKLGVTYLQEIGTYLVNRALKGINSPKQFSPAELLEQFNKLATNNQLVEKITKQIQQLNPYLSDSSDVIRALLWTLSASNTPVLNESDFYLGNSEAKSINHYLSPSAVDWLKGIEIPEEDARIMRIPAKSYSDQEKEAEALRRTLQLLRIIADYSSVVICFDELDAVKYNKHASETSEVIADFIKTLHNSLDKVECKNSVLLLSLWLNDIFRTKVVTGTGLSERVCSLSSLKREPISLDKNLLNEENGLKLVAFWLESFVETKLSDPYQHLGGEAKIKEFARNKPTPRQLWQWCAENWKSNSEIDPPTAPIIIIDETYKSLINDEYPQIMENETAIADSFIFALEKIIGKIVENVLIQKITRQAKSVLFQFKIEGVENGKSISIGVGISQSAKAVTVGAMLNRLIDYPKYKITRGCLVRSEKKKINKNTQAFQSLEKLIAPPLNGEFVNLKYEELIEIYALYLLSQKTDLDPIVVAKFITQKAMENLLIKDILSDPSGVVPDAATSDINYQTIIPDGVTNTNLSEDDFKL